MDARGAVAGKGRHLCLLALGVGLIWIAGGCAQTWRHENGYCYRQEGDPMRRVENYADPELCNRPVKQRGPHYLRVPPPETVDGE